jgi:hypothetical protein
MAKIRHFLSDYFKNKTQSFKVKDSYTLKIIKQKTYNGCKRIFKHTLLWNRCKY